ncbi:hypothetical protein FKM82_025819 [Ascaphus truei]
MSLLRTSPHSLPFLPCSGSCSLWPLQAARPSGGGWSLPEDRRIPLHRYSSYLGFLTHSPMSLVTFPRPSAPARGGGTG